MRFPGFIGPAYTLKSVNVDCQQCINLYPEINEMGKGKADEIAWLRSTPGLENILEVGDGPIRLVHFDQTPTSADNPVTRIFVVSGNELYKVEKIATVWTPSLLGELDTATGPVRAASVKLDLGITVFVDGTNSYLYWKSDAMNEDFADFASFGYPKVDGATHVVWIDGYFIYNSAGTSQFFVSNLNDLNIDPLSFGSSEGDPDNVVALIANQRDLWVLNERTTEVYVNTGNADFPFERVQGGFIEKGCVAPFSVATIESMLMWLGRDKNGQGTVYAGRGLNPERISTHAIETAIQGYADISTATAYTYQSGGHPFYILNFAEATWVYDISTKLWHQRAFLASGVLERQRPECHSFIPEFGIHMLGDYESNKLYQYNDDYYFDDEDAILRQRTAPHIVNGLNNIFYKKFQLDMETGVGLDGSGLGTDPQVIMQFSDDGGHTWSDEMWASAGVKLGGIGQFKTRVIWRRLGKSRDRVFRVKITDPVKVAFIGAEIDLEVGDS